MRLDELQNEIRRGVLGERAAARTAAKDVERWPALPGQVRGDAKDEETRIREAGFDPERFRDDPEYQGRPEIQALAAKYVRVAAPREAAARTEEMVRTSKYVAEHADEMQVQLRRDELDRAIARLQAERDALPAADEDEGPEDEALAGDEASVALPDTEEE